MCVCMNFECQFKSGRRKTNGTKNDQPFDLLHVKCVEKRISNYALIDLIHSFMGRESVCVEMNLVSIRPIFYCGMDDAWYTLTNKDTHTHRRIEREMDEKE